MKTVHVAAGIICATDGSNKVLAVQRGYGSMTGLWEFPGGKIEADESAENACRRELNEELNIEVSDLHAFYTVEYDYPDFHLRMDCFLCHIANGEPQHADHQLKLAWVDRNSLVELPWMPADIDLINLLARA